MWKLTVRAGPQVTRERFATGDEAFAALAAQLAELQPSAHREPASFLRREFSPVRQVAARLELAGGPVRGGIDLRGDGSAEAWTGRVRRTVVEQQAGEDAVAALRRVLVDGAR